jgi:hypothetical protein
MKHSGRSTRPEDTAITGQGLIPVVALVFGGAWVVAGRLFARAAVRP